MKTKREKKITICFSQESYHQLQCLAKNRCIPIATLVSQMVGNQLYPKMFLPEHPMTDSGLSSTSNSRNKLTIKLSDSEYRRLEENASSRGLPVSLFLKQLALYGSVQLRFSISTYDLSSFMSKSLHIYSSIAKVLLEMLHNKTMTQDQYDQLSNLMEQNLKLAGNYHNQILKERKAIRKKAVNDIWDHVKKDYVNQQLELMKKNGGHI